MASHSRRKFTRCIECLELPTSTNPLSARGLHADCALKRMRESAEQLKAKEGPYYDEWVRSMRHASRKLADLFAD